MTYRTVNITSAATPAVPLTEGAIPTASEAATRMRNISQQLLHDQNVDSEVSNMQHADARRMVPRGRTDNLNEDSGRRLTAPGETITQPSIFSHRRNRRNANAAIQHFTPAQRRVASAFIRPSNDNEQEIRDSLNSHFENGGTINDLPPNSRRFVGQMDAAIQKAEKQNDRMHVVYMPLKIEEGTSRQEFLDTTRTNSRYTQHLMGYTQANHDINKVMDPNAPEEGEVYVQLETSRGMYVGGNGASGHLLPRGVGIRPVNVEDFEVDDGNGGTKTVTVIQAREVRPDERTVATE